MIVTSCPFLRFIAPALGVAFLACASTTEVPPGPGASGGDGGASGTDTEVHDDLVVFTTKTASNGDLGGLAGADAKCNTFAKAAGLMGKFRAWLSDSSTDAISRVPEGGPWRVLRKDGTQGDVAFADKAGWEGYPKVAIKNTEFGKTLSELTPGEVEIPYTWTGTDLGGKGKGCHCSDWTSSANPSTDCPGSSYGGVVGSRLDAVDKVSWTNIAENPCDARGALLCFQLPE